MERRKPSFSIQDRLQKRRDRIAAARIATAVIKADRCLGLINPEHAKNLIDDVRGACFDDEAFGKVILVGKDITLKI
jgi:hypothetical protein